MTVRNRLKLSLVAMGIMITTQAVAEALTYNPEVVSPGQCFIKGFYPAKYVNITEKVLASEASEKMQIIPAKYETKSEKIKVSDGTQKIIIVPTTYKTVSEKVLVQEASIKLIPLPATYKTITKKVLVSEGTEKFVKSPAQYKNVKEKLMLSPSITEWKERKCEDRGCNQSVSEVVCLVDIPAVYQTVTKKVVVKPVSARKVTTPPIYKTIRIQKLVTPATTRTVQIPAVYQTITKRVVDKVASSKIITTPSTFKTITRKVLVTPAKNTKQTIPATYKTITKRKKIAEGYAKWVPVFCKESMDATRIKNVQKMLRDVGHYDGSIDGIWGSSFKEAVRSYQKAKGLPVVGLSLDTMYSLKSEGCEPYDGDC